MNSRRRFLIASAVVVISGVMSVLAAPELPAGMATHWTAAGQPDGMMSKPAALALFPAISAVLLVVFAVIPRIGPLRENIVSFRPVYDWFVVVFVVFMTVIHGGVIAFNLGYEFDFTLLVLAAVAGLFYYVGVLLTHAERNWFVGIRTPWTLSSDEVWARTHHLGGRLFKLTAIISLIGLFFGDYAVISSSSRRSLQRASLLSTRTTCTSRLSEVQTRTLQTHYECTLESTLYKRRSCSFVRRLTIGRVE